MRERQSSTRGAYVSGQLGEFRKLCLAARGPAVISQSYWPAFLKYIGGEPLLHPDLPAMFRTGRAAGIAQHHLLVTNGDGPRRLRCA